MPEPIVYASYLQQPTRWRAPWRALFHDMTFVVRTSGDPLSIAPAAQHAVAAIDPDLPVANIGTVRQRLDAAMLRFRYVVVLVTAVAGTAIALAAVGVYGMMAGAVSERTREIGVRKSLGAAPRQIVLLVARRAGAMVGAGLALGIGAALVFTRLVAPQLWGVGPDDPMTYAIASLLLVGIAGLACLLPARHAVGVDPARTLRSE
jgi:putative ABC transport system permease protein